MLKWNNKTELTDATVAQAAKAVIFFDLKEAKYMLKLSATAKKAGLHNYKQSISL